MTRGEYWDAPVLKSVVPVVEKSSHVRTSPTAVKTVAGWMAYEEFAFPSGGSAGPFDLGSDPDTLMDLTMLISTLNFAFTDFDSGVKFTAEYQGGQWSDSEGMFACVHEAITSGVPLLDGEYLADVTQSDLERVFRGNINIPMLEDRVSILNGVGRTLTDKYGGRFHRWVRDCAPAMYADGDGILERMVVEFPRFNDVSPYKGGEVKLFKLAQLSLWSLHMALHSSGAWSLRDLDRVSAFADYIVPVALRLMGIMEYSDDLEDRINRGVEIVRDSEEEVEIRAHTLYATALLTDEINAIRPQGAHLVIPQTDYRLWKTYHATFWPHHLTRTVMY